MNETKIGSKSPKNRLKFNLTTRPKIPYTYSEMELIDTHHPAIEKRILVACKTLLYSMAGLTTLLLAYFTFGKLNPVSSSSTSPLPVICKATLGQGALSLISRSNSLEAQSILQQLILVGVNTRPDQDHDRQLTFALRTSGEQKKVSIGETVFLQSKKGILSFSKETTDLCFLPFSLENDRVVCKLMGKAFEEQFILASSPVFSRSLAQENYVEIFKKGNLWSTDVFLSGWGGEEYRELTKKLKVSIGSDVFFLSPGDYLWWNGERWVEEFYSEKMGPIATLKHTSSQGALFQIWDETGFSSEKIHLTQQPLSQVHFKIDEIMTAIRPRASTEITCQLGKRRVIVKEGDWWIRTDNRWRQVRTTTDLEAFLHHQIPGELFIFEKVETSKGKVVLKGRAFDQMRTFSEPISLVVQTEKKQSIHSTKSTSKGSALLAKNRLSRPPISNSSKESGDL